MCCRYFTTLLSTTKRSYSIDLDFCSMDLEYHRLMPLSIRLGAIEINK